MNFALAMFHLIDERVIAIRWRSARLLCTNKYYHTILLCLAASRGAEEQAYDLKWDGLWVRFPLEKMKCLIFSFPRSGFKNAAFSSAT